MGKKRKTTYQKKKILSAVKENNIDKLKQIFNYFDDNNKNLATIIDLNDSILSLALDTKNTEILELFLNKGRDNIHETTKDRLLHEVIELNDLSMLDVLIKHGFLKNSECSEHKLPPLFELVGRRRLEWIERFYKAGVSFDQKTRKGLPLLHFALQLGQTNKELIKRLISYGAKVSARYTKKDETPLHYLFSAQVKKSKSNVVKLMKVLLKFGADANCSSIIRKESVLYTVAKKKNFHALQLLIMYGAIVSEIVDEDDFEDLKEMNGASLYIHKLHYSAVQLSKNDFFLYIHRQFKDDSDWAVMARYLKIMENIDGINLLSILKANENKLTDVMRNPKVCELLLSADLLRFYSYWNLIFKFLAKKGKERHILLNRCEEPFMRILKWKLPHVAVQKIFEYLDRTDLRCLYTALSPDSCMERLVPESMTLVCDKEVEDSEEENEYYQDDEDDYYDDEDDYDEECEEFYYSEDSWISYNNSSIDYDDTEDENEDIDSDENEEESSVNDDTDSWETISSKTVNSSSDDNDSEDAKEDANLVSEASSD